MNNLHLEICLDSLESALAAQAGGAARVELCGDLSAEGTTPSAGMIALVRNALHLGVHVMIRPRGGDFFYSDEEFEVMKHDIAIAKRLGADGVVFGVLTNDKLVDAARMRVLIEIAKPMSITFHRAFDIVPQPLVALEEIINLGIDRILTSGQQRTAIEGLPLIKRLVEVAKGRIIIMPASGITSANICPLIDATGVAEIHVGKAVSNMLEYPHAGMFNAKRWVVDCEKVKELIMTMNEV